MKCKVTEYELKNINNFVSEIFEYSRFIRRVLYELHVCHLEKKIHYYTFTEALIFKIIY
jgi:hypothetical protein